MNGAELQPVELPLYSRLRKRVAAAPMAIAPGPSWVEWLRAQVRQGLSAHELAASALEAWLWPQEQRIPREAVVARLSRLPTDVQVLLPRLDKPAPLVFVALEQRCESPAAAPALPNLLDSCPVMRARNMAYGFHLARWHVDDLLGLQEVWRVLDARGRPWRWRQPVSIESPCFVSREAAVEWCESVAARIAPGRRAGRPAQVRWSAQRLRSGTDYREWLLTLPAFPFNERFGGRQHFDVDHLLMHMRTSVQGAGEQRFLLIEELQSDYNQAISRIERRRGKKIGDNAFQATWVELGLRVALLIACRQGLAGVATSTGAMHDVIYRQPNAGRAAFYDDRVARALQKLARALGLASGTTAFTGYTQRCIVLPVRDAHGPVAAPPQWHIAGEGAPTHDRLRFPSREQALRYAQVRLETEVRMEVPVLWMDAAARQKIFAEGLPVLGAVTASA